MYIFGMNGRMYYNGGMEVLYLNLKDVGIVIEEIIV